MPASAMTHTLTNARVPVIGFVAFSGTGKTTLLKQLIPLLRKRGVRLAAIKHSHHKFDIDTPGKDSYELRKAGVDQMLVASYKRWALMVENTCLDDDNKEPSLNTLIAQLDQTSIDLILVEGFKHERFEKIELNRPELGHSLLYPTDECIIAFASTNNTPLQETVEEIPHLNLNCPDGIADFIISRFKMTVNPCTA